MTNFLDIREDLASVMDILAKSAVAEISRLVDDGAALLRLELSRSHREISVLKRSLQLKEDELQVARRLHERYSQERVFGQEWSFILTGDGESAGVEQVDSPLQFGVTQNQISPGAQCADLEKVGPEPVLIKREELEEDILCHRDPQHTPVTEELVTQAEQHEEPVAQRNQPANSEVRPEPALIKEERLEEKNDPQPTSATEVLITQPMPATVGQQNLPTPVEDGKKQEKETIAVGDPEELSEQQRCEHGDEELSGLEFVVRTGQEEFHVAQRLDQTGCEHSAGRLNNLGSEYVMYERDSQLWTSFTQEDNDIEIEDPVCPNATEQCSEGLLVSAQLQSSPALAEASGTTPCSFRVGEKSTASVRSTELWSEVVRRPQGRCRKRRGLMTKEDVVVVVPRPPAPPPSFESNPNASDGDWQAPRAQAETTRRGRGGKEAHPTAATTREKRFSCGQCGKSFTTRPYLKIHRRIHTGERPFGCGQCGKSFYCASHLTSHQRSHTGEKPYSCALCANSYSHLNSLKWHFRVHTEARGLGNT